MDEQKQCNISEIHVNQSSSTIEGVEEQYKLLNRERILINEELAQEKKHERQINYKIWYFSYLDGQIDQKMWKIRCLECNLGKVKPRLPTKYVPRTTCVLCLSGREAQTTIRPDPKRCKKRVIKKGRMDIKYFEEVQEEHISLMKPGNYWPYCGTQELDDMMEGLVQRINHGNKKRADEMRIFQEINNFKKTKESYVAPEPPPYYRERRSKWDIDQQRAKQHKINIRLDDIEKIKGELIGREARVRRLKAELEHVRKNISCLNKKLENINIKLPEAYKRDDELVDRKKELISYSVSLQFRRHKFVFTL